MSYEKIVSVFDSPDHAEAARESLEAAGFSSDEISIVGKNTMGSGGETFEKPGFWHRLFGGDVDQREAGVYGNTVGAGGAVLTVRVPDSDVDKAVAILNQHADHAVDVESRSYQSGALASGTGAAGGYYGDSDASMKTPLAATAAAGAATVGGDQVLRLAEEEIQVGKRTVQEGMTRIRRFVTEKPVEAQVSLHEEHAEVVRRAVSNPDFVNDIDWSDKTIEVVETAEQAVVGKTARIAEEVLIRKEGTDRTETVRDTVRRQQVEVERVPENAPVKKP